MILGDCMCMIAFCYCYRIVVATSLSLGLFLLEFISFIFAFSITNQWQNLFCILFWLFFCHRNSLTFIVCH